MLILGIETSCDETAAAVVENGTRMLSNVVSSQVHIHSRFGGVVPELASRNHIQNIIPVTNFIYEDGLGIVLIPIKFNRNGSAAGNIT